MTIFTFFILQILLVLGAVVQTTTGASFVLTVLIGLALFNILPLEHAVLMAMLLSLVQIMVSLRKDSLSGENLRHISYVWILLPSTILGVVIFYKLISYPIGYNFLYGLLGLGSLWVAISFFLKTVQLKTESSRPVLYGFMGLAGITGGLFSVSGPPLLYILYRQPWSLHRVRQTLYISFALVVLCRLAVVVYQGNFKPYLLLWTLISIPTVVVTTWLTKKYLHLLSDSLIRKITAVFLTISGINILYKSISMSIQILLFT